MKPMRTGGGIRSRSAGQGLPEYALILTLITVAVIAALTLIGGNITNILTQLTNAI